MGQTIILKGRTVIGDVAMFDMNRSLAGQAGESYGSIADTEVSTTYPAVLARRLFEAAGGDLFHDPWATRDAYVEVILDRSPDNVDAFLGRHGRDGPGARSVGYSPVRTLHGSRVPFGHPHAPVPGTTLRRLRRGSPRP